jgi:mannosyltransferase
MLTQQGTAVPATVLKGPTDGTLPARLTRTARVRALLATPWLLPVLLTAALGLYRSTTIVLWWDELSTLDVARRPLSKILATATHVDAVHSVYYVFMHFWMLLFGSSVLSVRLPSVLAMCGATVCTAVIARRLFDRRVALTSATIFALIPGVARYASETRSYALVVLGSALALIALLRALERPSRGRWALYGILLCVTGALNLIALTALATHLVVVMLSKPSGRRAALRSFAVVVGCALLLVTPILVAGVSEASAQLGPLPKALFSSLPVMWQETGCSTAFSVLVVFTLPLLLGHRRRVPAMVILAAAVLPVLVLWLVSINSMGFNYFARYLLFVLPAWSIAVAAALDRVKGMPTLAFAASVLLTVGVVAHDQIVLHGTLSHFEYDYPGNSVAAEDYPAAAAIVEQNYRPGDAASFSASPHLDLGLNYYLPADEHLDDIFVQRTDYQTNSLTPQFCLDTAACVAHAPARLWVFQSPNDPDYGIEPVGWVFTIDYLYQRVDVWNVPGITVSLLERVPAR